MNQDVRRAIARINAGTARGTGTLVAPDLVLTALHVVANRTVDPPEFYPGVTLTFPDGTSDGQLIDGLWDRNEDWILIRVLTPPPGVQPVPLADAPADGEAWSTFGFPEANKRDGMALTGTITNRQGTLDGTWAMQLYSQEAAAGGGAPVPGLSGGPVIIDDAIVGVMRFALMKEGLTVAGTVYACPVDLVVNRTGDRLPLPDPTRGLPGLAVRPLPPSPYRFLERFRAEDAEIYCGRSRELRQLYEAVTAEGASPIVLLYGQSGTGKSSLLDAGLVPRLEAAHVAVYLRRDRTKGLFGTLFDAIAGSLPAAVSAQTAASPSPDALRSAWLGAETVAGKPLVVVLDQVDEAFTLPHETAGHAGGEGSTELAALADALVVLFQTSGLRGRLVLGFRKEYFAEIQKQLESRNVPFAKVFLQSLDSRAVADVVAWPRRTRRLRDQYGLEIEEGLAAAMGRDVTADRDAPVAPTLQVLLSRMWEEAKRENEHAPRFGMALYERLRATGYLVSDFFDQQLKTLEENAAAAGGSKADVVSSGLALDVLAFYTTPLGTTEPRDEAEVTAAYPHRAADVAWLVQEFKRLYLLSDLAGDAASTRSAARLSGPLAQVVRARLDKSQQPGPRARRVLENRAAEWGEGTTGTPLDPADLALAERGLSGMRAITPAETRLLAASRGARDAQIRSRNRRRIYASAAAVALLIAAAIVTYLSIQDQRQKVWRELIALDAKVPALLEVHPLAGLITAIQAVDGSLRFNGDSVLPSIKTNLARALDRARERRSWRLPQSVTAVAIAPDGRIVAGTSNGALRFFRLDGAPEIPEIQAAGADTAVLDVAFSEGGDYTAAALGRAGVSVWMRDGKSLGQLHQQPDGRATAVSFAPASNTLVATYTSSDGTTNTVCLWNDLLGEPTKLPVATATEISEISTVRTSRGGLLIATLSDDVRVIDSEGKVVIGPFTPARGSASAVDLTISSDRTVLLAYASSDSSITVWDATHQRQFGPFTAEGEVISMAFGREGRVIVAGTSGGTINTFNLDGSEISPPFVAASSRVGALAASRDGHSIVIGGSVPGSAGGGYVRVIDAVSVEVHFPLSHDARINQDQPSTTTTLAFLPSGPTGYQLVVGGLNRTLDKWTVRLPAGTAWFETSMSSFDPGQENTSALASDVRGGFLVVGAGLQFRDASGAVVARATLPAEGRSVAVTPDGQTAIVGDKGGQLTIWDVPARKLLRTITAHTGEVLAVAITPAGDRLLSGSDDGSLCFWQVDGTKTACTPTDRDIHITAALFHPDGTAFAATSTGRVEHVGSNGRLLMSVIAFRDVLVTSMALASTETVFAASKQGVRWIDVQTGAVLDLQAHEKIHNELAAVAVSPDGHLIAAATTWGNVYWWRIGYKEWLAEACGRLRGHDAFLSIADPSNISRSVPEACTLQGVSCVAAYQACVNRVWNPGGK